MLSGGGIRSEEKLKEFSGMMALTTGSENKAGQDTVSQHLKMDRLEEENRDLAA